MANSRVNLTARRQGPCVRKAHSGFGRLGLNRSVQAEFAEDGMELPDIPGICERDVDLLLLEELSVSPDFGARLIELVCKRARRARPQCEEVRDPVERGSQIWSEGFVRRRRSPRTRPASRTRSMRASSATEAARYRQRSGRLRPWRRV